MSGEGRRAHVIVTGNEKGGAGKSTVAMHLTVALLRLGKTVGIMDLDVRQRTLSRYVENRERWIAASGVQLPMPELAKLKASSARNLDEAELADEESFAAAAAKLQGGNDFVIVDAPGGDSYLSRRAHAFADTLITPLNDSFVDFDLLGEVDTAQQDVVRPSFYSEMVWECRKRKMAETRRPIDWVVMRNRMSPLEAKNKARVGDALKNLSNRIGFRIAPGLSERVIFRELFPSGLTLLDLTEDGANVGITMSHVAARQELRDLMIVLKFPGLEGQAFPF